MELENNEKEVGVGVGVGPSPPRTSLSLPPALQTRPKPQLRNGAGVSARVRALPVRTKREIVDKEENKDSPLPAKMVVVAGMVASFGFGGRAASYTVYVTIKYRLKAGNKRMSFAHWE